MTKWTLFHSPWVSNLPPHGGAIDSQALPVVPFYLGQTLRGGSAVAKNTSCKLAAILAADVVCYTRLIRADDGRRRGRDPQACPPDHSATGLAAS